MRWRSPATGTRFRLTPVLTPLVDKKGHLAYSRYQHLDILKERFLFSRTTEYALRAMVWLAQRHPEPQTTQEIAEVAQIPVGYLSKVMQGLGRAGLTAASRGLHGGFTLVRAPDRVTVLE